VVQGWSPSSRSGFNSQPLFMTTLKRIDDFLESKQGKGFRRHLGASIIGRPCARQLWYTFRWARRSSFKGRILRLFQRGHEEEIRLINFMRKSGIHVEDVDPDTGDQYRIIDWNGHFGGSLDSILFDTPEFPMIDILAEYKTHNDKSFKKVKKDGVKKSKYEHYIQSQIYMHYKELPAALYFAVNKNDDEIDIQLIEYDRHEALKHVERAGKIINAEAIPPRIPNASPGWYICQWCDYKDVCHHHAKKDMNCRTCIHSAPVENSEWFCNKFHCKLEFSDQLRGCLEHSEIVED